MGAREPQRGCEDFPIHRAKSHQRTAETPPRTGRRYERLGIALQIKLLICGGQLHHRPRIVRVAQRGEDASVRTEVRVSLMGPLSDTRNTQRELSKIA